MKKKFLATLLCGTMLFCTSSFTFASDEMENQEPLTPNIIENGGDSGIILFSSHDKTVQVYISTSSGTNRVHTDASNIGSWLMSF